MSQEKVERRKEQKLNMKKDVKKRKRNAIIVKAVLGVVALLILGWLIYSIDARYTSYRIEHHKTIKADLGEIVNFKLD